MFVSPIIKHELREVNS